MTGGSNQEHSVLISLYNLICSEGSINYCIKCEIKIVTTTHYHGVMEAKETKREILYQ